MIMKNILFALTLSISLLSHSAFAATQTLKATVNGMVCAFCAQGIEKNIRAMPQTQDVYVNLSSAWLRLSSKLAKPYPMIF
jgi:transcription elongation factor Elf1